MTWTVETLNSTVEAEIDALPADQIAKFIRISNMIQSLGLNNMRAPHVKHLEGSLMGNSDERRGWHFTSI